MNRAERHVRGGVEPATCPRATQAFVGRDAELARLVELLDQAVLFLVYGVAGIGKSELVFRAVEQFRECPGWERAMPSLVQAQAGMDEQHLTAVLRLRTGAHEPPDRLGGPRSLTDELEPVVAALNARRQLLVIDDLHLVDEGVAARVLDHLARRVRKSRILGISRIELPIAPEAVITRLAPLEQPDARRMLAHLGRRLGVEVTDATGILQRAGGSPFFLQREMVSACANTVAPAADPLDATLRALPAAARKLLLRVAVLSGRVGVGELGGAAATAITALARGFFVDVGEGTIAVHELVRGAVLRMATPTEIAAAHRAAARLLTVRASLGGPEAALAAVEAVRHRCAAGDHEGAFAFIAGRFDTVSGAGLDHLLIGSLGDIRAAVPARAVPVDLILARIFVRRSLVPEAQKLLARLAGDTATAGSVSYLTLASTVASQRGDLPRAEELLQRAHRAAPPTHAGASERARIALHLADILSLRGETARARAVLEEARSVCDSLGGRTVLRWGWSAGFSFTMEQDFARAVATVAPFTAQAASLGAADLRAQLGMIEVLARAELHDVAGSRKLSSEMVAPAARAGALREPIAAFYAGIAAWAEGDLHAARAALRETWTFICAHEHTLLGLICGHYLSRVHLALGDVRAALDLFERTTRRAVELGMGSLTSVTSAQYARVLVEAGDTRGARTEAARAFAGEGARPHSSALAHQAIAQACAQEGDLAAARRHLRQAETVVPADAIDHIDILLDRAEVELCGGDAATVVQAASTARNHYAARGRRYLEARACVALAGGQAALGGPGDLAMAEEALARADELITRHRYDYLALRATLARAAVAVKRGDRAAAERMLCAALAPSGGPAPSGGVGYLLLGCALGSARERELPAGLAATLGLLGLRAAPPSADVVVDIDNASLTSRHGSVKGRPVLCALLACLIDAGGRVTSAEELYCSVWGAVEYHPLRHRNTLYVTMNRLRQTLAELCPGHDGELIETRPAGWRLRDGFVARKTM